MSIKRIRTILKKEKDYDIFNFNHIDPNLEKETVIKLKEFYEFYHKRWWCTKAAFHHFKKVNLALTMSSTGIVALGVILGGITMNPVILGVVSGIGLGIKTLQEIKDPAKKLEKCKAAFTTYEKILATLRNYLRGVKFDEKSFLEEMKIRDEIIIELGLDFQKYESKYIKTFKNMTFH